MKFRCRCSNRYCRKRKTLRKHPAEYKRLKCLNCGGKDFAIDLYRQDKNNEEKDSGKKCGCSGRILQHRYGQVGCIFREDKVIEIAMKSNFKNNDEYCPF